MFFNFIYADICLKIHKNAVKGISYWKKYNVYNYFFIMLILILFYLNSNTILLFFKVNQDNIPKMESYFKIGLFIPVFMGISFALKQLMFSFDKNKAYIKITIFSTLLSLLMLFLLLQSIGLRGAFISTIIIEFLIIISYSLILKSSIFDEAKNTK
jgi:Na+-driven multidrug efflux pump